MARLYDPVATGRAESDPVQCECLADNAEFEVVGVGNFTASFRGRMEALPGVEAEDLAGVAVLPLTITSHETRGIGEGIGAITVQHDFDRDSPQSFLQENVAGAGLPGTQEMHVNILVTLEVLPGLTLRNVNPGILRNPSVGAFPPVDAIYTLTSPVDLEDRDNPGPVVARILAYSAHINPT